jgi:ubiquinone biosynthesis protein
MDEQDMVDQLVRMRVVGNDVDRGRLRQDLSRLIHKYHGLPLDAIRAQDVMQDATPIAFRHHLRVPSELWLLGKTLAMMEGVGLKLDPDFDFVAFSRPYVRRFVWRMALPQNIGPTLLKRAADWADLVDLFPQASFQLLTQATRGDLEVKLTHRGLDQALARLDRSASRISLSMLLAALIVGLALLIPAFGLAEQMGLATVLVIAGFTVASLLGLWLAFSIWRSRK